MIPRAGTVIWLGTCVIRYGFYGQLPELLLTHTRISKFKRRTQSATQYTLPLAKTDLAIAMVPLLELFGSLVHAAALADAAQVQLGGLGGAASSGGLFPDWAAHVSSGNLDGSALPTTTHRFMSSPLSASTACTCLQGLCC